MIVPNLSLTILWIACAFSNAYDLTKPLEPQGPLGVTLDYSLALSFPEYHEPKDSSVFRNWVWTSHLKFKKPVSEITDQQLWQIAHDAHDEANADRVQYGIGSKSKASAMSVLAWGNEIMLASSQKGKSSFTYEYRPSPVLKTLELCQIVWKKDGPGGGETDNKHRTEGKCGELMAAHLYYSMDASVTLAKRHARVGTVVDEKSKVVHRDPCGDPKADTWGCNLFVAAERLKVLDRNDKPEPYDLETLAGGVSVRNQIQLCAEIKR